jgi:hypothetical protein
MSNPPILRPPANRRDPVPRLFSAATLGISILALVFSMTGLAAAATGAPSGRKPTSSSGTASKEAPAKKQAAATKQREAARKKREAAKAQKAAKKKTAALEKQIASLELQCPVSGAIDMGSYCLEGTTYKVPTSETGQNDYMWATRKCTEEGGWLPTAAELIGAANKVSLKSTIDDSPATSATSEVPEAANGIKDEREMTADLFTTAAGASAAGSEGVTAGAKGVGTIGEPDPVPMPANPVPNTLDYITVYDNHDAGGFAGGVAVGKPEPFRCAYAKAQGKPRNISSRS